MTLSPGAQLGAYEIVALVGAGGMGEVYRARDTRLDRTVAIKVLPAALAADPHLRDRFERETRAIASLNHPHICALFDVGHQDGVDFLVLEYLDGETLAERLARGGTGLPPHDALAIAIQICDALDKAHRSGIVHRDLKPANVFLVRSGGASASAKASAGRRSATREGWSASPTAKLLDFGLAKSAAPVVATTGLSMLPTTPPLDAARGGPLTAQGTILGTFQYMAPEQSEGIEADARTDIFAFGALLFEMLTGRTAFEGKTRASLLGAILKDEPPRVSTVQPLAPASLDRIVVQTPSAETSAAFSPDGRWFAYQSNESGQDQIYVQPFPPTGGQFQVSKNGGARAVWRPDGKELFFLSPDSRMMAAAIDTTGQFQAGIPTPLFTVATLASGGRQYAVTKDGRRFLVNVIQQQSTAIPLTVVVNWLASVQK